MVEVAEELESSVVVRSNMGYRGGEAEEVLDAVVRWSHRVNMLLSKIPSRSL
jgi:hypothetical protein